MAATLSPFSPFLTRGHEGGSLILDRNLLAIKAAIDAVTSDVNRVIRIVNIDVGGASINDATFWLSSANAGLPSARDMSGLGTGVLQQSVSGGYAAPIANYLPEGAWLFGGPNGLFDYDETRFFISKTLTRVGIGTASPAARLDVSGGGPGVQAFVSNSTSTGYAELALVTDQGVSERFELYATGSASADPAGGNGLIIGLPDPTVVTSPTPSLWVKFAGTFGGRKIQVPYVDQSTSTLIICNPDKPSAGGASELIVDNGSSTGAQARFSLYGEIHPTFPDQLVIEAFNSSILMRTGGANRTGINAAGDVFVYGLGAGGIVWADSPDGKLGLVTIGSGLSFVGGTLSATGGGGTVTGVTGTAPIVVTPATPNPNVSLTIDSTLAVAAGALGRAAISGVISIPAGSNTAAFPNFSAASILANATGAAAPPGVFAASTVGDVLWYNGAGLQWSHIPVASVTGAVADTRNINTTAPITGGGNLSADRTIGITDFVASGVSHARGAVPDPGAVAGTTKFLREDATWGVPPGTGQPAITWPAADLVLVSTGTTTDPTGYAWFDTVAASHSVRVGYGSTGRLGVQTDGGSGAAGGEYAFAVLGTTTYDKVWLAIGGKTVAANGPQAYIDVNPNSTAISSGAGTLSITELTTMRIRSAPWTGGGGVGSTIAEMTSLYIDGPPAQPAISPTLATSLHIASGPARFDGAVQCNQGADLSVVGTSSISFIGDGNSHNVTGSVAPVLTGVTTGSSLRNGEVQILFFTNAVTVKHNGIGPVPFDLAGGVDFVTVAGSTLTVCMRDSSFWKEIGRS